MKREFERLENGGFDLLVAGGGVWGAWIAYDAALRGLSVVLVDKDDWASGTSSSSTKLIHGGLRYLEQLQFGLVRRALDERQRLSRLAPHRVRPLRLVLPVHSSDRVGGTRVGLGLWLYDRLAGRHSPVERYRWHGRSATAARWPHLAVDELRGAYTFGDCQTDDARFVIEIVSGAVAAGAVAVNHARLDELMVDNGRCHGAMIEDVESGRILEVRAQATVLAAGAWVPKLLARADPRICLPLRMSKGVHLLLPRLPVGDGILLPATQDRRVLFALPWQGHTLLGTTDTAFDGDPDQVRVEQADVDYLLDEARRALAGQVWTAADILGSFAGLRVLHAGGGEEATSRISREWYLATPLERLFVPVGGKFTSARADAAEVVDRIMVASGRPLAPSPTATRRFPWAPAQPFNTWRAQQLSVALTLGFDEETAEGLLLRYGSQVTRIFERVQAETGLAERIVPRLAFARAEVAHAAEDEMGRDLVDILRRRLPLALLGSLELRSVTDAASLAGRVLGWSDERQRHECLAFLGLPTYQSAGGAR